VPLGVHVRNRLPGHQQAVGQVRPYGET
jgi:hypothetical protein